MRIAAGDFTVGVEEEYQLVDSGSGELRSRARWVIARDWSGEVKPEMQQHTVEVDTGVCEGSERLGEDLARLRLQASIAAEAAGLRIVAAGTHPFSAPGGHQFTDKPVYAEIRREYRELAETQSIFGMHVHVGVPSGVDRVRVANAARFYLPHLLALSASSPFYQGRDTGYSSFRALVWRRWPRSGAPPRMEGEAEFGRLLEWLTATGCVDAPGRLYWELRPHHRYPTLEFRVMDVTPRLADAVALAALARSVVAGVVAGLLDEPGLSPGLAQPLLGENAWRAARYGSEAEFVDLHAGRPATLAAAETIHRLVERLGPVARELGDAAALAEVEALLERGCAAREMRALAEAQGGDLRRLVSWLADETLLGAGLDRRNQQRMAETSGS